MIDFDEVKRYLPKYLSPDAQEDLFRELKAFTDQPHDRLYSLIMDNDPGILQGDGLRQMPITNLPDPKIEEGPVMVLSNTCDLDPENRRYTPPRVAYCPIVRLSQFVGLLEKKDVPETTREQIVDNIKKQRVATILYLPQGGRLPEDCLALLDRANNCDISSVPAVGENTDTRLFSLSQFGWYLFLFKISLNFTRMQEAVSRT